MSHGTLRRFVFFVYVLMFIHIWHMHTVLIFTFVRWVQNKCGSLCMNRTIFRDLLVGGVFVKTCIIALRRSTFRQKATNCQWFKIIVPSYRSKPRDAKLTCDQELISVRHFYTASTPLFGNVAHTRGQTWIGHLYHKGR